MLLCLGFNFDGNRPVNPFTASTIFHINQQFPRYIFVLVSLKSSVARKGEIKLLHLFFLSVHADSFVQCS